MFRRRIVVRDAAANGPAISDRHVRDLRGRFGKQWPTLAHVRAAQQIGVPDQRPDRQVILVGVQAIECFDSIDIDKDGGTEDAEVEHGQQALTAGEHSAVLPGIAQQMQRLRQFMRRVVVEPCRLHECLNLCSAGAGVERRSRLSRLIGLPSYVSALLCKCFTIMKLSARRCQQIRPAVGGNPNSPGRKA